MQLQYAVNETFIQLTAVLAELSAEEYKRPCSTLYSNTIGQHVRHIIELFQCLDQGYDKGLVNYEKRKRDLLIETDKELAGELLYCIREGLNRKNKALQLEAMYDELSSEPLVLDTNYYREVAYNLEHTIHHMALIRIGITEVSAITIPENFGVASSTLKYRKQCAQ